MTADVSEMLCWREMEKFSWVSHVKNETLQRVEKKTSSYVRQKEGRLHGLVILIFHDGAPMLHH